MTDPQSRGVSGIDSTLSEIVVGPLAQNPAPFDQEGQVDEKRVRALADQIVTVFLNSLPSNWVSETKGPYYVQQFQAAAEELARIQVLVTDAYEDCDYDFTRSEVLFQFLATLVFPDAVVHGLPTIDGDITYREFLKRMVALLLQGSKVTTLVGGIELLSDAEVSVIERVRFIGKPGVGWTQRDQFTFDVDISKHRKTSPTSAMSVEDHYHPVTVSVAGDGVTGAAVYADGSGATHTHTITGFLIQEAHGTGQADHTHDLLSDFADLPVLLEQNVALVLQALDPAHTLYQYRNLFRETFRHVFQDAILDIGADDYNYEDFRRDCAGFKSIDGDAGSTLTDRYLFRDAEVSFRSVRSGAPLTITSGLNTGTYKVVRTQTYPYGDDPSNAYPYLTSPTGLTGLVRVVDGVLEDTAQNFGLAVPGETMVVSEGPNAGTYLLERLLGEFGGPVGVPQGPSATIGPATRVRPSPSLLRVLPKFPSTVASQPYSVEVDRLGTQTVRNVVLEDVSAQFYAPGGPYTTLITSKGPLIRRDGTPATANDVTVVYNATTLTVSNVNPYTGTITLASPVAGFIPGVATVRVSYSWVGELTVGFVGLNNPGLTLNRWDMRSAPTVPSATSGGLYGGTRSSRFRLGVGLGLYPRRKSPVQIAHRYIAFERGYTAALNSPTTLRLNNPPGRFTVPYAAADAADVNIAYDGNAGEPGSEWTRVGTFVGSGTPYTIGKTDPLEVGYWKHDFALPIVSTVSLGARLSIEGVTLSGIFTGVGIGFHNNRRLFFAGALTVANGLGGSLNHIGILVRPGDPSDATSWVIGPNAQGRVQGYAGTNVLTVPATSLPTLFSTGDKFQVYTGTQAGIYTVTDIYRQSGIATLVVTPAFPADPRLWGNRDVTVLFEAKWDQGPCTWRIYANTRDGSMSVLFGGATGATLSLGATTVASPAYLGPDILPEGTGRLLWGSISRQALSTSTWDFVRGVAVPYGPAQNSRGTYIDTTMTQDPEDGDWYALTPFGVSDLVGGSLRITATPAEESLGTTYGYGYTDPFLNGKRVVAFDAKVAIGRDTSGAGGAALSLRDTQREARLGNLLYQTIGPTRSIFVAPTVSLVGSVGYASQGWASVGTDEPAAVFNGPNISLSSTATDWELSNPFENASTATNSRFTEFRLSIQSATAGLGSRIGFSVTSVFGFTPSSVTLDFLAGGVVALRSLVSSGILGSWVVGWDDGVARTYRIEYDGALNVVLTVDDNYVGMSTIFFFLPTLSKGVSILSVPDTTSAFSATLSSLCMGNGYFGTSVDRTFGIWLGGDPSDIDNWKIPRSDGTNAPNSDATLAVPVDMNWTVQCWVRLFMDPTYGVAFIRPDLAPPPGYTGDFATESMDPSAGWVSLEYERLPRLGATERFGHVSFGNLNPAASTIQTWDDVRYRVFTNTSLDYRTKGRMVLNRWNVVTSAEYLKDTTPEEVIVSSVTATRVSLRPCGINADRVFSVVVNGTLLPPSSWHFNKDTQDITLDNPLPSRAYPVSVAFAVGQKSTFTYLQTQPLEQSPTILNEGTPPVPMGQVGTAFVQVVSGTGGPTPAFPPAVPSDPDYFLRDQYLVRKFEDDPDYLYEQMTFLRVEDGGSLGNLSSLCDGDSPLEMSMGGLSFEESFVGMGSADRGRGPGVYRSTLLASGGDFGIGGYLGPAVYTTPFTSPDMAFSGLEPAMLFPTYPAEGVVPGSDSGAVYREILWVGTTTYEEDVLGASDQDYASNGPATESPSVAGSVNGTAWYQQTEPSPHSRLGPWTGYEEDLDSRSLLYGASSAQPTGEPVSGVGLILSGGAALPDPPVPVVGTL